ncbi:MAG: hypothetical protein AAB876_02020 [Patescibacteria group bacterium]
MTFINVPPDKNILVTNASSGVERRNVGGIKETWCMVCDHPIIRLANRTSLEIINAEIDLHNGTKLHQETTARINNSVST